MNKVLIIILIGLTSFSGKNEKKYFEGVVEYNLSYKPIHKNITVDYLEENYGFKEVFYYKNGFYKRVKLNKKGDTISVIIHNPIKKKIYGTHISTGDTIMTYSTLLNVMKSQNMKKLKNTTVNDEKLVGVELKLELKDEFVFDDYKTHTIKYFFSKKYEINPNDHKNQKDGFYNEMVESYPYLVLKMILNDGYLKEEIKVFNKIDRRDIGNEMFEVDESKPIKEI